jgi:hypothetical protein
MSAQGYSGLFSGRPLKNHKPVILNGKSLPGLFRVRPLFLVSV